MNITQALKNSYSLLIDKSKTYKLDCEILLAFTLKKKDRLDLFLNTDQKLNELEKELFLNYVDQRKKNKPIAKIINQRSFWKFDFNLSRKVLIPRPETEVLISLVTNCITENKNLRFLDIGCGSGCISISLLDYFKKSKGIAIDISKEAVLSTKFNLNKFNLSNRLKVLNRDIFKLKTNDKFDLIISNPPYLKLSEYSCLDPSIKIFEPYEAFISDNKDGIKFYEKIIFYFKRNIKLNGYLAFEIGDNQIKKIEKLLYLNGFTVVSKFKLINNQVRCILAKKIKNYALQ